MFKFINRFSALLLLASCIRNTPGMTEGQAPVRESVRVPQALASPLTFSVILQKQVLRGKTEGVQGLELVLDSQGKPQAIVRHENGDVTISSHEIKDWPQTVSPERMGEAVEKGLCPYLRCYEDGSYGLSFRTAGVGGMHEEEEEKGNGQSITYTFPIAATQYGFKAKTIVRDGNCLFRAIADQLQHRLGVAFPADVEPCQVLRRIAASHIVANAQLYQALANGQGIQEVEQLAMDLEANGTWAGDVVLAALSRALQVSIVVVHGDTQNLTVYKQEKASCTLYVLHTNGNHYDALHDHTGAASLAAKKRMDQALRQAADVHYTAPESQPGAKACIAATASSLAEEAAKAPVLATRTAESTASTEDLSKAAAKSAGWKAINDMNNGLDPNARDSSNINQPTALHTAVDNITDAKRCIEEIAALKEAGAKTLEDASGATPLHILAYQENANKDLFEILLSMPSADINARDKCGFTPLRYAAEHNQPKNVDILLGLGANKEIADNDCWTPMDEAEMQGHQAVIELLKK